MKKAVMYGAGNIGRGFIGQLFSQSGYEVVFADINAAVIDKLNADKRYPIRIVADDGYEEVTVEHVRGVNARNAEDVAAEIASAEIMATAVGVNVLPHIAKPLAMGLKQRWAAGNQMPLNIIICENLLDANHYLEKLIKNELSEEESVLFDRTIGLVEASIGRMVPVMTPEMQGDNLLRVYVEEYCTLPVDKDGFKGEIPSVVNMVPFSPFSFYIQRKLFMHNMGHATMAYLGFLNNNKYIWEASKNNAIKLLTLRALQESAVAMAAEHKVPLQDLLAHTEDLLYRFGNKLLGDTIERVGKDPVRKLHENDRLIGAANLCIKQGIDPVFISVGIAAAFLFAPASDEFAARVRHTVDEEGLEAALAQYGNVASSSPLAQSVTLFYNLLKQGISMDEVLEKAEKIKNYKMRSRRI